MDGLGTAGNRQRGRPPRLGNRAHPLSGEAHPHREPAHFVGDAGAIPCMAVAFAGFGCFLVYLWIVMGNMAQRWSAAPIPTCAFGFMLLFSGIVLGELAAWTLYRVPLSFGYPAAVSIVSLFMLVVLAWSMADGSRYAHETAAMGGVPMQQRGSMRPPRPTACRRARWR